MYLGQCLCPSAGAGKYIQPVLSGYPEIWTLYLPFAQKANQMWRPGQPYTHPHMNTCRFDYCGDSEILTGAKKARRGYVHGKKKKREHIALLTTTTYPTEPRTWASAHVSDARLPRRLTRKRRQAQDALRERDCIHGVALGPWSCAATDGEFSTPTPRSCIDTRRGMPLAAPKAAPPAHRTASSRLLHSSHLPGLLLRPLAGRPDTSACQLWPRRSVASECGNRADSLAYPIPHDTTKRRCACRDVPRRAAVTCVMGDVTGDVGDVTKRVT
jgi:hypothetical protein